MTEPKDHAELRELTPEEAEAAYEAAVPVPLSEARLAEIVRFATTSPRMTPDEILAARERCNKATPGPWIVRAEGEHPFDEGEDCGEIAYMGSDGGDGESVHVCVAPGIEASDVEDDASFVANARTDLPKALDALEAALAREAKLREACRGLWPLCASNCAQRRPGDDRARCAACRLLALLQEDARG